MGFGRRGGGLRRGIFWRGGIITDSVCVCVCGTGMGGWRVNRIDGNEDGLLMNRETERHILKL